MARQILRLSGILALLLAASPARAQLTFPNLVTADAGILGSALVQAGYLDVTLYGADPTGTQDSTQAIQSAINDAMNYAMVTYLPTGTYLVSAPLVGEQVYTTQCQSSTYWGKNSVWQAPTLVGPASGPRPVIRLADQSPAFQDPADPTAVLHFYNDGAGSPGWSGNSGCEMFVVIRDLNVEVGNNNPGAIGIQNPGTQGCYLENIQVNATGAYAGIEGTPGQAEMSANLEVIGGQYGIIPYWPTTLVGVTLSNQTVAALSLGTYNTLAVVGFQINETAGTPAVINTGYPSQRSQVSLIDGVITISGTNADAGAAIQNLDGHDLYVSNVFVQTTGALIQNGDGTHVSPAISGSGGLDQISEYVFTNPTADNENGEVENSTTFIDGGFSTNEISNIQSGVASAPTDLVLRHLPGQLPSMDDPGVVNVIALGADPTAQTDSTAAIQQAINQGSEVFLPRGMYLISSTLQLQPNTRLFGVPGSFSQLWANPSWNPDGGYVPFLQTANTADGATYVGDLFLQVPNATYAQTFIYGLEWQAGRSSINRQVYPRLPYKNYSSPSSGGFTEAPRDLVHVAKNGGGRFFGLQLSAIENGSFDPSMRDILVEGTTAPLTFYATNPEHTPGPMVEVDDAANVRFLGSKVEGQEGLVQNSNNVLVASYSGHNTSEAGKAEWVFADSTNVAMTTSSIYAGGLCTGGDCYQTCEQVAGNCTYSGQGAAGDLIFAQGIDAGVNEQNNVSLFAQGTFDESPFPHCGDGVCDGAETSANCPADCTSAATTGGSTGGSTQGATGVTNGGNTSATATTGTGTSGTSSGQISSTTSSAGNTSGGSSSGASWTACQSAGAPIWANVPSFFIPYTNAVILSDAPIAPASNAALSATVQAAWDTTNLYVQVQVTDPTANDNPGVPTYYSNAVELYLDGTDSRTPTYDAGDVHFTVSAGDRASADGGFSHSAAYTDGGYVVDFTVPFATLGANRGVVGFDIAIDANADGGPNRASQLMWSGDGGAYLNPQQFGALTLGDTACGAVVGTSSGTTGGSAAAATTGSTGSTGSGMSATGTGCGCGTTGDPLGFALLALPLLLRRRRSARS